MEKKINNFIKKIEIQKNCLDKLNKCIEEKCLNNGVLFIVDFLTFKHNSKKLEEIKKCSLNYIEIIVISNTSEYNIKKLENKINETFDLIVGIGEFT